MNVGTAVTEQKLGAFIKYVNGLSATSDNDTHYKYELLAYLREAQRALSAQPQEVGALPESVRELMRYRMCASYNDSYFTEPAGLVKRAIADLERFDAAIAAQGKP